MRQHSCEVVETLTRRIVDVLFAGGKMKEASARMITCEDNEYKFFLAGNKDGIGGVGMMIAEKWLEKVIRVKRVSDRIMAVNLLIGKNIVALISTYEPQSVLDNNIKDKFYDSLINVE